MKITNFRDVLALLIGVIVFPGLWALQGKGIVNIPEGVIGASIAIETLIAQFYFRRASAAEENPITPPAPSPGGQGVASTPPAGTPIPPASGVTG